MNRHTRASLTSLCRLALRAYPASWRLRYGAEMARLLEDTGPSWSQLADLVRGVVVTRTRTVLVSPLQVTLIAFVVAAVITPSPDIATQAVYASPMLAIYCVGVLVAKGVGVRRARMSRT